MAINLFLQENKILPKTTENWFLLIRNDGYYWFLYKFFKVLNERTGQMIDLCDHAFFDEERLDLLCQTMKSIRKEISDAPDIWEQYVATMLDKEGKETNKMYSTVYKQKLESILAKLENAISEAKEKNIGILFLGD